MRHEQAQVTTLATMAVRCKASRSYNFLKYGGDTHTHQFSVGDVFLLTIFMQVRMSAHNAPNEAKGDSGEFVLASDNLVWEIASITYHRHDGVVLIPAEDLGGESSPFKFIRAYDDKDTPLKRVAHLCNAACWYGEACKLNLARTPEEIEAISF